MVGRRWEKITHTSLATARALSASAEPCWEKKRIYITKYHRTDKKKPRGLFTHVYNYICSEHLVQRPTQRHAGYLKHLPTAQTGVNHWMIKGDRKKDPKRSVCPLHLQQYQMFLAPQQQIPILMFLRSSTNNNSTNYKQPISGLHYNWKRSFQYLMQTTHASPSPQPIISCSTQSGL